MIDELLAYRYALADFLPFAPDTYYRLFERYHRALWPLQPAAAALGVGVIVLTFAPRAARWRHGVVAVLLAAVWLWVGWAFHLQRYATINWAANGFAAGFMLQGLLLLLWAAAAVQRRRVFSTEPADVALGLIVALYGLLLLPLLDVLSGQRTWVQSELFALTPDPTAIVTLAVAAVMTGGLRWLLVPLPLLWCLISGATAAAMGYHAGSITPAVAAGALLLMTAQSLRRALR